jgi:hypothetical protein
LTTKVDYIQMDLNNGAAANAENSVAAGTPEADQGADQGQIDKFGADQGILDHLMEMGFSVNAPTPAGNLLL